MGVALKVKENIFTPLNEKETKRLKFDMKDVKILSGSLNYRGLGKKATIQIKRTKYKVLGRAFGLPNCQCDTKIVKIK